MHLHRNKDAKFDTKHSSLTKGVSQGVKGVSVSLGVSVFRNRCCFYIDRYSIMKENRGWVALQVLHEIGGDRICQLYKTLFISLMILQRD